MEIKNTKVVRIWVNHRELSFLHIQGASGSRDVPNILFLRNTLNIIRNNWRGLFPDFKNMSKFHKTVFENFEFKH